MPRNMPVTTPSGLMSKIWFEWLKLLSGGITETIITTKLTPGGTNGLMVFTNGVLTSQTPAT